MTLVIANPCATAIFPGREDALLRELRRVSPVKIVHTTGRGHATTLARDAMRRRTVDVVIAMGGDGTANEVVNGLLADGLHDDVPTLGVAPAGATNVFARSLGFSHSLQMAAIQIRESVGAGRIRRINVSKVDDRYFLSCVGIGFDAAIIEEIEKQRSGGQQSTLFLAFKVAGRRLFTTKWPSLRLELSSELQIEGLRWIIVANSDPWTFINARALRPTPQASLDLGMDIYARNQMGPVGLLWSAVQMFRQKRPVAGRTIHLEHDLSEFSISPDALSPVQIDGDMLGYRGEMHFTCIPSALRVLSAPGIQPRDVT